MTMQADHTESNTRSIFEATMGVPQVRDTTVVHTLGKRYRYFPNMNKYQTASNLAGVDVSSRKRLRKSVPRVSNNSASDDASSRRSLRESARRVSNRSATNDASSKKSLAKSLRMSAPQVSRDLGQTRGRVSPLQDHRISKKSKRNQITISRVGSERDTHGNFMKSIFFKFYYSFLLYLNSFCLRLVH